MKTIIKDIDDKTIEVNSKIIKKDMRNNWIAQQELTPLEAIHFQRHIRALK